MRGRWPQNERFSLRDPGGRTENETYLFAPVHILVPAAGSLLFLIYFRFFRLEWDRPDRRLYGDHRVALPFAVSIVCGGSVRLEEENHFQIFLGSPGSKWRALAVKLLVLGGWDFWLFSAQ